MSPRKKVAISSFVQSGNFESSFQAGLEPWTSYPLYPKKNLESN